MAWVVVEIHKNKLSNVIHCENKDVAVKVFSCIIQDYDNNTIANSIEKGIFEEEVEQGYLLQMRACDSCVSDNRQEWHNTDSEGTQRWFQNDLLHREDGPAVIYADGSQYWYLNGQKHREDGPAEIEADGCQAWYVNGELHREDGPAELADGCEWWYRNGELHRIDGPAVVWRNASRWWYRNGLCHRENGPAVIMADGREEYWINGKKVDQLPSISDVQ